MSSDTPTTAARRSASWSWTLLVFGWSIFLLGYLFCIAFFLAGVFLFGFVKEGSFESETWGLAVATTLFGFAWGGCAWTGNALISRSRRMRARLASAVMAADERPPIVYLRSFQVDGAAVPATPWHVQSTYEEHLARAFHRFGPFVAIGRPDEALPESGAARLYVGDQPWQVEVLRLLSTAQAVVLVVGETAGLMWELKAVVSRIPPERLLIFLPFGHESRNARASDYRAAYQRFVAWAAPLLPRGLPADVGDALFIHFSPDWTPHALQPPSATFLIGIKPMPLPPTGSVLHPMLESLRQDRVFLRPIEFSLWPMLVGVAVSVAGFMALVDYKLSVFVMIPLFVLPIMISIVVGLAIERKL